MKPKYTGSLYQLGKGLSLHIGQVVIINGPHDTFGQVVATPSPTGYYLIRGILPPAFQQKKDFVHV